MGTGTGDSGDAPDTTEIDVRVPTPLLEQIDETYAELGYTSRSEAVRDALRAWVNPPVWLSETVLGDLASSREGREAGETRSLDEVVGRYGVDVEDSSEP